MKSLPTIALSFALVGAVGVLTVATNAMVGRAYGQSGLGFFGAVTSVAQIFGTLCGTSLGTYGLTNLPGLLKSDSAGARTLLHSLFFVSLFLCLPTALVVSLSFDPGLGHASVVVLFFAIVATSMQNFTRDILRCHRAVFRSYLVLMTANLTLTSFMAYSLYSNLSLPNIWKLLNSAYILSLLVTAFVIVKSKFLNAKEFSSQVRYGLAFVKSENFVESKTTIMLFLPMVIASVAQVTLARTDILIASYFGSSELAGELTVSVTVASITLMGLAALNAIYVPKINAAPSEKLGSILREVQALGAIFTVLACAIIFYGEEHIIRLFGFESESSIIALRILMIGAIVNALTGPVVYVGLKVSSGKPVARVLLVALSINIIGDVVVFRPFGIVGLACVTALVTSFTNLMILRMVRRNLF